ncbi:MAG TPA: methionine synthase [Anaerolineae bacterium]|nr:methionine synthase [Anaerolineae bacterium]
MRAEIRMDKVHRAGPNLSAAGLQWLSSSVGSVPYTDARAGCDAILDRFPAFPTWPQLPRRSFLENMYVQFSERFPGVVLDMENKRIIVDRSRDLDGELEQLYLAYLENDLEFAATSPEYAAGLAEFPQAVAERSTSPIAVKGQITGPVSWGLTVVDQNRRPVLYDDVLADALARHLRLKAAWQERELAKVCPQTVIFVDEPYMSSFGSAFVALQREQVIGLLEEVFGGIQGLKGVHCCGNTDWSLLLETSVDILSFDTYEYVEALSLYPEEVCSFLDRGGIIAWGITPKTDAVWEETAESLADRLEAALDLLARKGVPREDMIAASLVTPSCGVGSLDEPAAERALSLTAAVADIMRERYGIGSQGE